MIYMIINPVYNAIIHLQADAVLVDSSGKHHPVHSFLLLMKFPMFRGLPDQKIRCVTLAEASSEVVELLVEMAYGSDRFDARKINSCCNTGFGFWDLSESHKGKFQAVRTNFGLFWTIFGLLVISIKNAPKKLI